MSNNHLQDIIYEAGAKEATLKVHAIVQADLRTGEIVYTSQLADHLFGYDDDELKGQSVEVLLPEELRERHVQYRQEYAKNPRPRPMGHGIVLFGKRKDGKMFPVQVSLSNATILDRQVVVAFIIDLTEAIKTAARIKELINGNSPISVEGHHDDTTDITRSDTTEKKLP